MKAITLWPEWAWAVCRLGKNVENRTWDSSLYMGEQFAIHAGMAFGGAKGERLTWRETFEPLVIMATRAGWRMSYDPKRHALEGYSTNKSATFSQSVVGIPTGSIVAVATFIGALRVPGDAPGEWPWWAEDQFGWTFDDLLILPEPVKCRGRQRLWNIPDDVMAKVESQLG